MSLGFIGFGEAGFYLARGLRDAGAGEILAYDLHRYTTGRGEQIEHRAESAGVTLVDTPEALLASANTLLSVVVADAAIDAARASAPYLSARHVYADLNSVSPRTKNAISSIVCDSGAAFVEATMMAPVPRFGHRVPILLGGPSAAVFAERLGPFGMQTEIISDRVGSAAAVKMCRSIVVKGLEALLLECAVAAEHYDAGERIFRSLEESFPGLDWASLASYMIGRVVAHGERRSQEMVEVAQTLEDIGIEPVMTRATARRQKWCADLGLGSRLGSSESEDYREVARVIREVVSGMRQHDVQ